MKPQDSLNLRADFTSLASNNTFQDCIKSVLKSEMNTYARTGENKRGMLNAIDNIAKAVSRLSHTAPNFFVSTEMSELIGFASSKLDASDKVDLTLPPTKTGWVYFEKALPMTDVRSRVILVNAILWEVQADGVIMCYCFNDAVREPDDLTLVILDDIKTQGLPREKTILPYVGRWFWVGVQTLYEDEEIGQVQKELDEKALMRLRDTTYEPNQYILTEEARTIVSDEKWEEIKAELQPPTNLKRHIHAYWLLMNQTIIKNSEERPQRPIARRLKKMGLPDYVTVIAYRRTEYDNKYVGNSEVQWSHRWVVRGHWRWQGYKTEDGKMAEKRIWISPFVKGPADKPMLINDKVYALVQ